MKKFYTTSNTIAFLSFCCGTIIFISYQLSKNDFLIAVGIVYVLIALLFNIITLIYNINKLIFKKKKLKTITEILILLVNIPIAYTYFLYVIPPTKLV